MILCSQCTVSKFRITKAPCARVTFHANRDAKSDAWFDDDPAVTAKTIPIAIGEEIHSYSRSGLTFADPDAVLFSGWSTDPDKQWVDDYVIVEGDMDVYALTVDKILVTLDGNGGRFRLEDNAPVIREQFMPGESFKPKADPRISENTVKFSGWSRNPDAEVPDEDIIETVTPAEELEGMTLYAVYGEKVLERFIGNGGFFLDNPDNTVYESTKGKGHIFYGMIVHHPNHRMNCIGWVDQNGVYIPYETDTYPYYHVNEDTEYTHNGPLMYTWTPTAACLRRWDPQRSLFRWSMKDSSPLPISVPSSARRSTLTAPNTLPAGRRPPTQKSLMSWKASQR